jgi:hypothetical protein
VLKALDQHTRQITDVASLTPHVVVVEHRDDRWLARGWSSSSLRAGILGLSRHVVTG